MMGLEGEGKWGGIMGNWENRRGKGCEKVGVSKPGKNHLNLKHFFLVTTQTFFKFVLNECFKTFARAIKLNLFLET